MGKDQIKLVHGDWKDVSINLFYQIKKIIDADLEETDRKIKILALLMDETEEEFSGRKIGEVQELAEQLNFMQKDPFIKTNDVKTLFINGAEYELKTKLEDYSVAQYVDFQNYIKDGQNNLARMLSTVIIPVGKKYNDGYDIEEVIQNIGDNLSIAHANYIMFFFTKKLVSSIKVTQGSLVWLKKMMNWNKKMQMKKIWLKKKIQKVKQTVKFG